MTAARLPVKAALAICYVLSKLLLFVYLSVCLSTLAEGGAQGKAGEHIGRKHCGGVHERQFAGGGGDLEAPGFADTEDEGREHAF